MKITRVKLADMRKMDKNVRKHTEKQIKEYVRSLEMFGQVRPIVVDEDNTIIAGNGMYDALLSMGREEAECYVVTGLTEVQKKKLMLADNKIYELGYNDIDAFDQIIRELEGDVDVPGWDEELLTMLNATAQEATEELENYGKFPEEDVETIQKKEEPAKPTEKDIAENGAAPLEAPSNNPDRTTSPGQEDPQPEQADEGGRRFVTCPHCGRKVYI